MLTTRRYFTGVDVVGLSALIKIRGTKILPISSAGQSVAVLGLAKHNFLLKVLIKSNNLRFTT